MITSFGGGCRRYLTEKAARVPLRLAIPMWPLLPGVPWADFALRRVPVSLRRAHKGVCHFRHRTRHWRAPNDSPSRRRLHGSIASNDGCGGRHAACRLLSIGCGSHRPVRPTAVDAWRETRRTVTVRYHAEDLSRAFVTEGTRDYLEVRFADMRSPAFSLFEQRTALKAVRSEDSTFLAGVSGR